MPKGYPPLTLREIKAILVCWGFAEENQTSGTSHRQWKKIFKGKTYRVTVDNAVELFDDFLLKSMIHQQAELTKEQFYSGSRSAAKKLNVTPRQTAH